MHLPPSRHRRFQIGISVGITVGAVMALIYPHLSAHATAIGVFVNLLWIWEQ